MMRAPVLASLCALVFALAAASAHAAAPNTGAYLIEVVIFRQAEAPAGEALEVPAEGRGFGGQLDSSAAPPTVLRTLDASQMQLGTLASKLRASGNIKVLAHAAWVQTAADWPKHSGLPLEQLGLAATGLTGNVYLERGPQYLHLGFDLRLAIQPGAEGGPQGGTAPAWSLSELRKVKYNERNYFDHPGFGVIAIVSPAKRGDQ
ncbi:MAG: hypothetical protein RL684_1910 [Pseudomonadota bacterium]|jgi:hypothetical protein